jgi:hypothetical protein
MGYNKKYKIIDAMINKQLKGDEIVLKCVSNGDGNKNPKPKQPTLRELILSLTKRMDKQDELNQKFIDYMDKHP